MTYGGQGTTKRGVHADDHAIIYTSKDDGPQLMPNEVLYKEPIRMNPISDAHKLDAASRVNYRKVYTVEHNVKVMFIGDLTRAARAQVIADYNLAHPLLMDSNSEPGYTTDREPPGSPQQTYIIPTMANTDQGGMGGAGGNSMGIQNTSGDPTPRQDSQQYYPNTSYDGSQSVAVASYSTPAISDFQTPYQQPRTYEPPGPEDYYSQN